MQATTQFVDGVGTIRTCYQPDFGRSGAPHMGRLQPTLDSPANFAALSGAPINVQEPKSKACIIDTTKRGDYEPTKAQLLAAEIAQELYGGQVTFVQANPSNFKELVQRLTGSGRSKTSSDFAQNQPLRLLATFSSSAETSSGHDSDRSRSASLERTGHVGHNCRGEAGMGSEQQGTLTQQAVSNPRARSYESEHNSSCSTSESGRLLAASCLGARRNSTFKQERRTQAAKKIEQIGLSLNILRTHHVSSNCSSPVTPFQIQETFEYSPTPSNSSYHTSSVSQTSRVFPGSPPVRPVSLAQGSDMDGRQMTDPVKLEMNYPSSPSSHRLEDSLRQMWQPQLLSLFP